MGYLILKGRKKAFFLLVFPLVTGNLLAETNQVVVTTSLLKEVVGELAGERISVTSLVAPNLCPGHGDIDTEKMAILEQAKLFLAHGFEPYLPRVEKAIRESEAKKILVQVNGNWQIPLVHLQAARLVCAALCAKFPGDAELFQSRLNSLEIHLQSFDREIRKRVKEKGWLHTPVLCNIHLADLLSYLGLKIIGTYRTRDDFTPTLMAELLQAGHKHRVVAVIDNLQAGPDTGQVLASDLKAEHIVFSNFPQGQSIEKLLEQNLEKLFHVKRSR